MSKRSLLRLATSICFIFSVMFLGQITAYADQFTTDHEYNFDFDRDDGYVYDSIGVPKVNGTVNSNNFVLGYNGQGKARHFDGNSKYFLRTGPVFTNRAHSIRFKIRKDASSLMDQEEAVMSTGNNYVFKVVIGGKTDSIAGRIKIYHSGSEQLISPANICDGKWHDILYTWDGTSNSDSSKLYIDNMATPVSTAKQVPKTEIFGGQFYIGYLQNSNNINSFIGDLDNIQIYNSVISPEASSNLKATGGDSKVDLTWNPVTDAISYTVKRSTTAGGPYTTIATGMTGTTYTDTDVTNGTTYYYVVSAIVNGSESWSSNEASATPQASTDPNQPTGNKALLVITMVTGERKEYEMTTEKINDFITWYNSKAASSPTYAIEKDYNKASFTARKDYIAYEQISNFEVNEYNN